MSIGSDSRTDRATATYFERAVRRVCQFDGSVGERGRSSEENYAEADSGANKVSKSVLIDADRVLLVHGMCVDSVNAFDV